MRGNIIRLPSSSSTSSSSSSHQPSHTYGNHASSRLTSSSSSFLSASSSTHFHTPYRSLSSFSSFATHPTLSATPTTTLRQPRAQHSTRRLAVNFSSTSAQNMQQPAENGGSSISEEALNEAFEAAAKAEQNKAANVKPEKNEQEQVKRCWRLFDAEGQVREETWYCGELENMERCAEMEMEMINAGEC